MDVLKPLFSASAGDGINLSTAPSKTVYAYFAVLERIGGAGGNQAQWDSRTLETTGGTSTVTAGVDGYNVIIFPQLGDDGSIDATINVGGKSASATISKNNSAGWRIFVF